MKFRKILSKINFRYMGIAERLKLGKKVETSISDLFFMQFKDNEFMRYDMVVRYLAIENFYGKNDFGFNLYKKMQNARISSDYGDIAEKKFRDLIKSYHDKGYDKNSCITTDKNLQLFDGSHRMAMCIYHNITNISLLIVNSNCMVNYTIDWFFMNGFSSEEINIIISKEKEIREKLNKPFSCVIWSPAVSLTENIMKDIAYFGTIQKFQKYSYQDAEYKNVVKAIYAIDDIDKWKIDKKLEHMQEHKGEIVVVDLKLDFPHFRIKSSSNMPLSKIGERIKKVIRTKYKDQIENYFFDIILHIADNYLQSNYMEHVFTPNINCKECLNALKEYQYALSKTESTYYPKDFPNNIPVGKDIDIFCLESDYQSIVDKLIDISKEYETVYIINIKKNSHGVLIRYELYEHLIFLYDISYKLNFNLDFIADSIKNREATKDFYKINSKYEYIYRMVSYSENKSKRHHLEYLKMHRSDYDKDLALKYCKISLDKLLQEN